MTVKATNLIRIAGNTLPDDGHYKIINHLIAALQLVRDAAVNPLVGFRLAASLYPALGELSRAAVSPPPLNRWGAAVACAATARAAAAHR